MGHTDIGWLADVSPLPGLEVGAWSTKIDTFKLYRSDGTVLFSEACDDDKYSQVLRWRGNGRAQVMRAADASHRDLLEWEDGWKVRVANFLSGRIIVRRWTKGDFWGDSRDELWIRDGGRLEMSLFTNPDSVTIAEPSLRTNQNYRAYTAVGAASYTYYPHWLYGLATQPPLALVPVIVAWDPYTDPDATALVLFHGADSTAADTTLSSTISPSDTSFTTSLPYDPGSGHYFWMQAGDAAGNHSIDSNKAYLYMPADMPPPRRVRAYIND
jgi:hypothetical protein